MTDLPAADEPAKAAEDRGHLLGEYPNFIRKILQTLDAVTESIDEMKAHPDHPNNWKNCDFACFELRKICEYLTLVIVLAHHCDDAEAVSDLSKWRPKDLLNQAGKLNEHPTPIPIGKDFAAAEDGSKQILPLSRPARAAEISAIYGQCSDVLHAGSLQRILDNKLPAYDVAKLERWNEAFRKLLEHHALLLPGIKRVLIYSDNQFLVLESDGLAVLDTSNLPEFDLLS
ncbi:hypothetical protein [Sphingopyxis sp.]|uniref:hypothetical protein n=1 Tax=Sphingopyxis sp. TaxID=1908224 RepID=UPI003F72CD14